MGIINVYCLYSKISQVYSAKFTFLIIGVFYLPTQGSTYIVEYGS